MAMLYMSHWSGGDHWRDLMAKEIPDIDFRIDPEIGDPAEIDAILIWKYKLDALKSLPNLRLICSLGAGVDHLLGERHLLPQGVPICRLVDPSMNVQMAEWCLMAILNHQRHWEGYRKLQAERRYEEIAARPPDGITVGIMGLGVLGGHLARVCATLGYNVRAWSRSPKQAEGVTCFHGMDQLRDFLSGSDFVVCLMPLTAQTTGIINAETLSWMKPGAYIVNGARGQHIVDTDLIAALDSGHIAGAAVDVQHVEPMPEDHPFWFHPKIVSFPHIAAVTIAESVVPQIAENYRRMRDGRPLVNQVDLERGY